MSKTYSFPFLPTPLGLALPAYGDFFGTALGLMKREEIERRNAEKDWPKPWTFAADVEIVASDSVPPDSALLLSAPTEQEQREMAGMDEKARLLHLASGGRRWS